MWKPYLKVSQMFCKNAKNILDRFHIVKHLNAAVDKTRREDVKRLLDKGCVPILTKSKWLWLHKEKYLSEKQLPRLTELLQYNLRVVRAYLMKEDFDRFCGYKSSYWAKRFLKDLTTRAMRSRIEPMKNFVRMMREHEPLLMNWFDSQGLSSGIVEGFNNKVKLTTRKTMDLARINRLKWRYIMHLAIYPSQSLPIDFGREAFLGCSLNFTE